MHTNGIVIKEASYQHDMVTVLSADVYVWDIPARTEYLYRIWLNSTGSGYSSIKRLDASSGKPTFVDLCKGTYEEVFSVWLERLKAHGFYWTGREFVFYVAGWCDARRE